ncbi:MAG: hypothetical protein AAGU19_17815 [Prolixibacteraceae bacterium]
MKNEAPTKQEWQTPEIVDMDIEKTASGVFTTFETGTVWGPVPS